MPRFSEERKSAVLKKLLPPHNRSVPDVAREEGISEQTLYNWRKKLRDKGSLCKNCNNTNLLAFFKPPNKPQHALAL